MKTRHEMNTRHETTTDTLGPATKHSRGRCNGACKGNCRCPQPEPSRPDMADLTRYPLVSTMRAVSFDDAAVTITWEDDTISRFHHGWLRENSPDPASRHPHSRERLVSPLDIPADLRPESVTLESPVALAISWDMTDQPVSRFDAGWLRAHCYTRHRFIANPTRHHASLTPQPAYWSAVMYSDAMLRVWLRDYLETGWSVVSGAPDEHDLSTRLGARIGVVRSSNFGFQFDVMSKAVPISNAYTASDLPLHTDMPHYELPPGTQILHCLRNDAVGGESLLSDGIAVANLMRDHHPEAFRLLSQVSVPFRFQDADGDYNSRHQIIECDAAQNPVFVNWSNSTLAPLDADPEIMPQLRAAIRLFLEYLQDPRFLITLKLDAGQVLVFDNRRMLHGRKSFDPTTGGRHLQGCYLDTSEVLSRMRMLERDEDAQEDTRNAPVPV
ncbi:TauD/TfdA family dioxygenase [Saliniramus sp.]|uniref:TauD/TfdA family dioxygenase n=1 Tax=Saliniramus sp. TaxID=2986772 RepID=UPI002CF2F647|nr:TauD/TfdA family dioxygenase [Saliniramus sp.]HMB10437.1 TauD/TfdA family dioxygenase [Saliniramus sp.]